jgi:hydroxypyruvate isomerase
VETLKPQVWSSTQENSVANQIHQPSAPDFEYNPQSKQTRESNVPSLTRRKLLQTTAATAAATLLSRSALSQAPSAPVAAPAKLRNNIHQSVSRWCYPKTSLEDLCAYAAKIGLVGVDLLKPEEFEIPGRYGLTCTMGYVEAGTIPKGLNRIENHAMIEAGLRKNLPLAVKAKVPNVITFSGNREGMSDEEGARNTIIGLKRILPLIEDAGLTLNLELLNSKRNHKDYMADHTAWGVRVCEEVGSTHIKLLYDIYHMQIMEGDLIATIKENIKWLGHFHTGGVPGRHELDDTQEVLWPAVMRGIVATGFKGYVAHEFVPLRDPLTSLHEAVILCDV